METKLNGLILAGGKSTRMGTDKGHLIYHNEQPHRLYLYEMLQALCDEVFISIREEQRSEFPEHVSCIVDENEVRGPFNGLLSAHHHNPKTAWLVLATDVPHITKEALQQLIAARDTQFDATAFATKESKLPEPLIAIWEPKALEKAPQFIETTGKTCPRKFLINHHTKCIFPTNDWYLANANAPEDYKKALTAISSFEK